MKYLIVFMLAAPVFAQQSSAPQPPAAPAQPPAAEQQAPAAEQSPAPSTEPWVTGSLNLGYRFRTDVLGSIDTYRSIVNLNEGPRVLGIDFTIQDPKKRLFDRIEANGFNWGDPYNSAHVGVRKAGIYDFRFDYRNILYFNALPSYGNPFAPGGYNQQSFDLHRRLASFDLDLLPGNHIVPYLAYDRSSGKGTGVSTWVQGANNDYAVPSRFRDLSNNYRGGLRFEFSRFHVTLEEGGTTFKDDDSSFLNYTTTGDRTTPLLGQTLSLSGLQQAYGIRAHSTYSRALLTATPFSWLTVSGQFLFSQPRTDVNYIDIANGNLALLSSVLFYSGQVDAVTGAANKPHVSANAGFELRPFGRLRIVESWMTDRYHDAAFATIAEQLLFSPTSQLSNTVTALPDRQAVNYNQNQTDLFYDLTKKITLRAGYRYVWGDATVRTGPLNPIGPLESGKLNRQVAVAGFNVRPIARLSVNAEYEGASTTHAYFRTSLNNYNRLRARARYQATDTLAVLANFNLLDNQNPTEGIQYDFRSRDNSLAVTWTPNGGKWISVLAQYDRATLRSNINYLTLPFLTPSVSSYRDNAHLATGAIDLTIPGMKGFAPKVTVGGSLSIDNGTRASRYYQPMARLSLPLQKHVYWNTEWRWYGFNENLYLYEGFRTHIFETSLRLSK